MNTYNPIKILLTENDGLSWCPVRIIGIAGCIGMLVKYMSVASPDAQGFGLGFAAILGAIAVKHFVEGNEHGTS